MQAAHTLDVETVATGRFQRLRQTFLILGTIEVIETKAPRLDLIAQAALDAHANTAIKFVKPRKQRLMLVNEGVDSIRCRRRLSDSGVTKGWQTNGRYSDEQRGLLGRRAQDESSPLNFLLQLSASSLVPGRTACLR
ncbi:MAG: hypothetical protein IT566_11400 [Rhodospirillaceae bacterium]|nr:hypothetical protein [Rhodospirillaceae bacterium]